MSAVDDYLTDGWAVVPLVKGEKRASTSWQKRVYAAADFGSSDGIALKCGEPSGWRVDVDLDALEAVEAAKELLPQTGLIHGRPGKPDSHYWYVCEGAVTTQWTDVKDSSGKSQMLVEIRSSGGYTAAPPSFHPSGDQLVWTVQRAPLQLAWDDLRPAGRNVALASLLARHWPGPGGRHHFVGHLAGFLVTAGLTDGEVIAIIRAAGRVAQDCDLADRMAFVRGTLTKRAAGERTTGGPKLAECIGEDTVAKMRGWLKLKDEDAILELNEKHFWVRMGKDDVIGREDDDTGPVFQRVRSLYSEYANRKIVVGEDGKTGLPVLKPLFPEWLESKQRRSYRRVVFAPPPRTAGEHDYNLWRGYAVEPKAGDVSQFLAHIHDVICSGNDDHHRYLLNLLALTLQEPGTPSGVAVVMRGKQGTGKGVFARTIGDIFGRQHYTQLDKVEQLAGRFNAALSGKIIVFADEAFFAGDKRELGALKRLITEPTLHIERKGIDGVDEENHVHLFMATNEDWSWPAAFDDRRGFLLEVSDKRVGDFEYFAALMKSLDKAALLHYFLGLCVDHELLRHVPKTKELRNQQSKSLSLEWQLWQDDLYDGTLFMASWPDGHTWLPVEKFYNAYVTGCERHRRRPLSNVEYGRKMGAFISKEKSAGKRYQGSLIRCYLVRSLADARAFFDSHLSGPMDWPDATEVPSTAF